METKIVAYEIPNTFTRDLPLDVQIELGINDWCAEDGDGRVTAYGRTRDEAIENFGKLR